MRRGGGWRALGILVAAFPTAGCAGGGSGSTGTDASTGLVPSGSPDAGTFVFSDDAATDASDLLLAPCNPTGTNSCSTGFVCYAQHTSATWWADLYGTCTFDCNSQTYTLCDSLGGVCGCPVPQGQTTADCSLEGGIMMVCVPGLKPGTSPGGNEGDGGCGTPGCGGGAPVDSGSPLED